MIPFVFYLFSKFTQKKILLQMQKKIKLTDVSTLGSESFLKATLIISSLYNICLY